MQAVERRGGRPAPHSAADLLDGGRARILGRCGLSRPRDCLQPGELPHEARTPRAAGRRLGLRRRGQDLPDFAALRTFEPQDKKVAHVIVRDPEGALQIGPRPSIVITLARVLDLTLSPARRTEDAQTKVADGRWPMLGGTDLRAGGRPVTHSKPGAPRRPYRRRRRAGPDLSSETPRHQTRGPKLLGS